MLGTSNLGEQTPLRWHVGAGVPALGELAGIPAHLLFADVDAIIEAHQRGLPRLHALFGTDVEMDPPGWMPISYGHVNALGCKLVFPDDSEVGHEPVYDSLQQGIDTLQEKTDFARQGMFPFYLNLWNKLKKAFPGQDVPFAGFKAEGPLTTAWCLRGHDFFLDIYDNRDAAKEFLRLVTDSIIQYDNLLASINGQPEFSADEAYIADDVAAMIGPDLWPDLVVPYLDQYYAARTRGQRLVHVEDLAAGHLKYLDQLGIGLYDPSVSPHLTPALVRDHCRVPFLWRLSGMQLRDLSEPQIERWVYEAVAEGPIGVFFHIERITCNEQSARKVKVFIRAARQVERLLAEGCSRDWLPRVCPH